jgi:hypothetical protein
MTEMPTHTSGAKREKMSLRYDLVPFEGIEAYARVAEFGAKKYAAWNWSAGLPRMQLAASLLRHLFAYMRGQDKDPESGLAHTDHIIWNAFALCHHHHHGIEDDRRPEPPRPFSEPKIDIPGGVVFKPENILVR